MFKPFFSRIFISMIGLYDDRVRVIKQTLSPEIFQGWFSFFSVPYLSGHAVNITLRVFLKYCLLLYFAFKIGNFWSSWWCLFKKLFTFSPTKHFFKYAYKTKYMTVHCVYLLSHFYTILLVLIRSLLCCLGQCFPTFFCSQNLT